jgi:sulfite reductase beta subunit-like hemoprotein
MPRKFKMAFESSARDTALTPIHDMAFVAEVRDGIRGFRTYVGGGLGATPQVAIRLEDFTPAEALLPTIEAVIRLFDRFGERQDKLHARIKFLVKKWGAEEFRKRFQTERKAVLATRAGTIDWTYPVTEETAPPVPSVPPAAPAPGFRPLESHQRRGPKAGRVQLGHGGVAPGRHLGDANAAIGGSFPPLQRRPSVHDVRTEFPAALGAPRAPGRPARRIA